MAKKGIVNVLLHGIFGYHFTRECIEAYAPAVCMHINMVSESRDLGTAVPLPRADFRLTGVVPGCRFPPDQSKSPVVPLPKGTKIDEFGKRHCIIRIPYPASPDDVWPLDPYVVGSIYAGSQAPYLNSVTNLPSMHAFSYERDGSCLELVPSSAPYPIHQGEEANPIDLDCLVSDAPDGYTNVHIWCTLPPMLVAEFAEQNFTPTGHLRRGFASLIDLFSTVEVTIEIPDGFTPEQAPEVRPLGVCCLDVDPARQNCDEEAIKIASDPRLMYGHVNCQYSNIITVASQ
jgi:hypothetical protein